MNIFRGDPPSRAISGAIDTGAVFGITQERPVELLWQTEHVLTIADYVGAYEDNLQPLYAAPQWNDVEIRYERRLETRSP